MLKYAIARLQNFEPDFNRREALVRTICNAKKQAKTNERIRFLLECKRASVYPRFIQDSIRSVSNVFRNNSFVKKRLDILCRQLLNESIKDAFRTAAFLLRECKRLQREVSHHHLQKLVINMAHDIYADTQQSSAVTLRKKFRNLCQGNSASRSQSHETNITPDNIAYQRSQRDDNEATEVTALPASGKATVDPRHGHHGHGRACTLTTVSGMGSRQGETTASQFASSMHPLVTNASGVVASNLTIVSTVFDRAAEDADDVWHDCVAYMSDLPSSVVDDSAKFSPEHTGSFHVAHGTCFTDEDGDSWFDCELWDDGSPYPSLITPRGACGSSRQDPPCATLLDDNPSNHIESRSNLSHQVAATHDHFDNREKFLNMSGKILPDQLIDMLNKGPNFALSRTVNRNVLKDVEIGLERGAFALRWKEHIERGKPQPGGVVPGSDEPANPAEVADSGPSEPGEAGEPSDSDTQRKLTLRPRFSDTDTRAAPSAKGSTEQALKVIKRKVLTIYKNHRSSDSANHEPGDINLLKELGNDTEVIVKRSDKCKGLVVLPKSEYIRKAELITAGYETVGKNPTPKLEAQTKQVIKATLTNKIPDKIVKSVTPSVSRTAELYGLPKTHKPDAPLRPIVSACGDPLDKLTWLLERIITQLLSYIPAHLTNTYDYLEKINSQFPHGLPTGSIIFSVDVANLYGNIPTGEAIQATLRLIERHRDKVDTLGLTLQDIEKLLDHCLNNNYVRFGDKYYKQTVGVAMGSRIAPPLAIIFMDAVESLILTSQNSQCQPVTYMRYIDDILGVWTHGSDKLDEYFQFLNGFHPALKFTIERTDRTPNGSIPFLDTLITVQDDGKYTTELYIKPMAAPIIIHYTSAHPMQCKRSVLHSQLLRAKRVGSNREAQQRGIEKIEALFRHNGYPNRLIQRTKHKIMYHDQSHTVKARPASKNKNKNHDMTFISLPFIDDTLARRVDGVVRASGLNARVAWTSGKTLAKHVIRSALESPPCPAGSKRCNTCEAGLSGRCHIKNVVYKITCNLCTEKPVTYIGETKRRVRDRFNEHIRDAKNQTKNTPFGDHVAYKHPSSSISSTSFQISIQRICKDVADLKIAESVEIRNQRPTLNTQTSSWPLLYPPSYAPPS